MQALIVAFFILTLDQWSKHKIRADFIVNDPVKVIEGFFNITYVRNTGAVFGILKEHSFALVVFSIVVMLAMLFFYKHIIKQNKWYGIIMGFMAGGIAGNLVDRVRVGWVTDFLDFHIRGRHWPAFNVADAAICCGAFLYILLSFTIKPAPDKPADPEITEQ